ncbi:LuxR C-terminal-related transcriptional regulator [Marinobacter sp. TBZ242]|uniref:LuxR C-terminal-related transcriptional regulator n=1 Tax=Marinobacter azerbaijanicus TaxID=3050455 RepID=A0ABT7IFZ1_9GAMM|nr:LuxR C-terminal-related transcriptional regulator [Marinobacter sp. TBZ242]MDL0432029.1 LuxR C-terminal-related transcriptional regulator [Marinobacter sp. TBZ242]
MKPFDDGCAANDEFQSALSGAHRGELIRDLLRQRVRMPEPVPNYLKRPALTEKLTSAIRPGEVLFVEAPSGFGKTHAVSVAFRETGRSAESLRWLGLTGQENDAGRLMALLDIALTPPGAASQASGQQKAASYSDALALMLSDAHWNNRESDSVLVIDNIGTLANPAAITLLQQLVANTPDGLALVLVSRKPLPFETHAYELEGRFNRISTEFLELTRSETFAFFQTAVSRNQLTTVAVEHLYSLTEGWITPLALYQRELQSAAEVRLPIQETFSVERFLRDAVLVHLTPGQQRSLRIMAEMEIVSDDLFLGLADAGCDHAFRPSAAAETGIPLRPLPGRGRWFRLNPLLHDWLQTPALESPRERALKASRWFSERNQFPEALRYALQSGDVDESVRIASEGSEALLIGQDTASLLRLRRSLPPGLLEKSARLKIVYGWVHAIGGQFSQARLLINDLDDGTHPELLGRIDALRAFILRGEGSVTEALEVADRALQAEELSTQGQLVTQLVRSSALCAAGKFGAAREANRIAARLAREAGDSGSEILAVYAHARIELGKGSLKHAEQLLRTGLDTAMNESARPARVGETRLQLNLVMVLWHQGREAEADRLLVTCIRHAEQTRDLGLLLAMALRVLICRTQNRMDDAFAWIGRAERTMQSWQVDQAVYVPVLEALKISGWLSLAQADTAAQAMDRLAPWREVNCVPEMFPMMPGMLNCLQARIELARGDDVKAAETVKGIRNNGGETLPFGLDIHSRLLESVVSWRQKGSAAAQKILATAIAMAGDEHYISPFAELKNELQELMEKTWSQLPDTPFTESVGRLYGLSDMKEQVPLAEPISDREQGVLELIAQGLSNQDIADRLHISLHTVKTHARRINAKLEVKSRTQAIVRARELGLL